MLLRIVFIVGIAILAYIVFWYNLFLIMFNETWSTILNSYLFYYVLYLFAKDLLFGCTSKNRRALLLNCIVISTSAIFFLINAKSLLNHTDDDLVVFYLFVGMSASYLSTFVVRLKKLVFA
jgi:dipeptide/tripeptide permease